MPDLQRQINDRVAAFVSEITDIAREAAMETLSDALGSEQDRRRTGGLSNGRASVTPRRRSAGGKRAPHEIQRTAEALHAHVTANPGERMEDIARALGSTTRDLALPVKKLLSDKRIRTEGQKRATRYYPADGRTRAAQSSRKQTARKQPRPAEAGGEAQGRRAPAQEAPLARSRSGPRAPSPGRRARSAARPIGRGGSRLPTRPPR